jgi:hypothetical protein
MANRLSRTVSLVAAAALAIFLGESLTARPGMADVYRTVAKTLDTVMAQIAGSPERRPRDLVVNGQPLQFTPYQSKRSVADITDEWLAALKLDTRPADGKGNENEEAFAAAANLLVSPKVSRVGDDYSVVIRFFDGDGPSAQSFLHAQDLARMGKIPSDRPMPGVAVSIHRPAGSDMTEVLMTRFDDVQATLAAFTAPADIRKLPAAMRPPAGAEVLSDIGDQGTGHTSRTVISSGVLSAQNWSDARANLLTRAGFSVEAKRAGKNGVLALHARRETVEADILYTKGSKAGEVVEVIEIRQPLVEGKMP